MSLDKGFSRRDFLAGTGALVVAFSVPRFLVPTAAAARSDAAGPSLVDPSLIDSWIAVGGDGHVTVYTGKEELGTGVATATLQMVADELDVPMSAMTLVQPDTWLTVDQGYSAGSQSLKTEYSTGLRIAGAEARLALLNLASTKLGAPVSQLTVNAGVISVQGDPSKNVSYGALIGDKKFDLKITGKAKPKTPDQYKLVGTSVPRIDIPDKILARFTFTQDVTVPGMLHGRVVRPPSLDARLLSVGGFGGQQTPGLVKVVVKNNFIGVVAKEESQAIDAAAALTAKWQTTPLPDQATIFQTIRNSKSQPDRVLVNSGSVDAVIANAPKQLQATYYYPYQMHGSMGASCAVADVKATEATVWTSSQGVYQLRGALATLLGMQEQNVHVIYVEGSGCYGLNGADNSALDAALMSQGVGQPVRVQYMRQDEHTWENYGTAMVLETRAGLDAAGSVIGWDAANWTASRGSRPGPPGNLPTGVLAGFPEVPPAASPPASPPLGPDSSNSVTSYDFPNHRVITHSVRSRFFTGPLRSPSRIQNTFANESFMDELAYAVSQDPIAFRLKHLSDPRLIAVIQAVRELSHWDTRPSPQASSTDRLLTGRGIGAMHYEGTGAYAGVVAQVQVDTKTGKVTVQHVWAAQDCGLTINPDGMRLQAEGCVVQGVSRALKEELQWTPQAITTVDWDTYTVLRFPDLPQFDFQIINRPDKPVLGAGEVVITGLVAAIANAIFDAAGVRLRQVPFTPARVRAALSA
jgi:CO/xanthine dehydrogenase Mo-binding subunit